MYNCEKYKDTCDVEDREIHTIEEIPNYRYLINAYIPYLSVTHRKLTKSN